MKRAWLVILLAVAGFIAWIALYPDDWRNWLGFSKAAYFQDGQNYAFYSGIGPMLITAIGLSTLIAGAWRHFNCHVDGCPRIARFHVDGTTFKVCKFHHPEDAVREGKVTHHHIIMAHRRHQDSKS